MKNIQVGPISSDTMRKEDILPVFVHELLTIDPNNQVGNDVWSKYCEYEEGDDTYWLSEESDYDLDEVMEELNHICDLPYLYFGASDGDGACYGFWVDINAVEDDIEYEDLKCVDSEDGLESDFSGLVALKTNGDYSLYECKNGKFQSIIW